MALFRGRSSGAESAAGGSRLTRHSSGLTMLAAHLRGQESLRVLDFGPTSAGNINLITGLGHSIYMSNLVQDAARPEYIGKDDEGSERFEVDRFLAENLELQGRTFDVVTLWDTLDYLPAALVQPTIDRLFSVMVPGGRLLAFFHSKATGEETQFSRYHLTTGDTLEMNRSGGYPLLQTWSNRQVEVLFAAFAGYKFFLAKDALREVIVTR